MPAPKAPPTPVRISSAAPVSTERVPLFYIDDTEYTIPAEIRPNLAIKYLRNTKSRGTEYAMAVFLEDLVGADGVRALAECDSMSQEQMGQLMQVVGDLAMGAVEAMQGN